MDLKGRIYVQNFSCKSWKKETSWGT